MNTTRDHDDGFDGDGISGDALLAAEYVLGLLDTGARRSAQVRMANDAAFADEVAAWETRFAPWLADIAPLEAPATVWPRIRVALGHDDARDRATTRVTDARPSLWDRLPFWRGLAAGGFAVAAASLAALFIMMGRAPIESAPAPASVVSAPTAPKASIQPLVVTIKHKDGTPAYSATVDPQTGVIVLMPAFMPEDARVPELWLIAADGVPRSLGVVPRDKAKTLTIPARIRKSARPDAVLAVSMEPVGGSPTGLPTGPVIAKGSLAML